MSDPRTKKFEFRVHYHEDQNYRKAAAKAGYRHYTPWARDVLNSAAEGKPSKLLQIYVAHPYGGVKKKISAAMLWAARLTEEFQAFAIFTVPWAPLCLHWPETPESRERGLRLDRLAVSAADGVILVGGEPTAGMVDERSVARCAFTCRPEIVTPDDLSRRDVEMIRAWMRHQLPAGVSNVQCGGM